MSNNQNDSPKFAGEKSQSKAPSETLVESVPISPSPIQRVVSIDIYRGMVMFLMLAEVLSLPKLQQLFTEGTWAHRIASWIAFHTSHVPWAGGSLHDMIQPGFSFLVGTAMAYSLLTRKAKGASFASLLRHAVLRSVILILLGIFLRSLNSPQTNFTFDDTLTQIGLGYWALFLVAQLPTKGVVIALSGLLIGYWIAFVLYPSPDSNFPFSQNGVPPTWSEFYSSGFATHFNKNSNLAWAFDRWWMNLFPRQKPFEFSGGGYQTLNFIPTLGTMILGLLAGRIMQSGKLPSQILLTLLGLGLGLMLGGWILDWSQICPIVKRIWTPAWVLWSGGISMLWLGALYWIADIKGWQYWAFLFQVVGANSIAAYVMSWTMKKWTGEALRRHFGWLIDWFSSMIHSLFGFQPDTLPVVQQLTLGALILLVFWLILYGLFRKRIFIRI